MARVEEMFHKMMKRFGSSDEHIKSLRVISRVLGKKSVHMQYRLIILSYKWLYYLRQ